MRGKSESLGNNNMFWRLRSSFPCYSLQKNEFYVTVTEGGKQGYIVVFHATLCKRWVVYHSYRSGKMDAETGLWMRDKRRCLESKALRKYLTKTLMTENILHVEFDSVYIVTSVRRKVGKEEKNGRLAVRAPGHLLAGTERWYLH